MLTKLPYSVDPIIIEQCIKCCLEGRDKIVLNVPSGNFFYDPWIIKNEFKDSPWSMLLDSLPFNIGEARVIKLNSGETYVSHADIDDRWHLNLTGEQSYLIDLQDKIMFPLIKDYFWYTMDAGKIHVASNFGSTDRFQLVVRQLLSQSNEVDMIEVTIDPKNPQYDYRYKFDNIFSPFLNKSNKQFQLKDFAFEGDLVKFKISKNAFPNLMNLVTEDFKVTHA